MSKPPASAAGMNTSNFAMRNWLPDFAATTKGFSRYSSRAMAENDKGLGSKIKGLFFESDSETGASEKSPADLVAELAAQSGGAGAVKAHGGPGGAAASAAAAPQPAGPALK